MNEGPAHLPPPNPDDAPHGTAELADLYAAGALSRDEAAAFEQRVAAGEPEYVAEFRRIQPVLDLLLGGGGEITPPGCARRELARDMGVEGFGPREHIPFTPPSSLSPDARREALTGAGAAPRPVPVAGDRRLAAGIAVSRIGQGRWYPTGVRGVRFRHLHASRCENRRTIILQMDPGTELPEHGHTGTEEVTMLSGDLSIAGTVLGPGDYIRISPGAEHGVPRTTGGCICIITSGYQPFPVSSWLRMAWSVVTGLFRGKSDSR